MPRSGNTLFSTVMSQNPKIAATANSVTLEIMKDLFLLKQTDVFQNFPDHKSLDNVSDVVFDTYYKDWPQEIIIDRGPVMTKGNFALMQKHYKRPFKCIVLLRDLMDVLASYMQWYTENPDSFVNRFNLKNDESSLREFLVETKVPVSNVLTYMGSNGFLAGIKYSDNELLVAVTEKRTKKEIDDYLKLFTEVNNG